MMDRDGFLASACSWPVELTLSVAGNKQRGQHTAGEQMACGKFRVVRSKFVEPLLDRLRGELPKPNISALSSKT